MPLRAIPFDYDDDWDDEDEERWRSRPPRPSFREVHPDFDSGAVHPELIYPVEHGPSCKGHLQSGYCEEYLWAYLRKPEIKFYGSAKIVPVREEYL